MQPLFIALRIHLIIIGAIAIVTLGFSASLHAQEIQSVPSESVITFSFSSPSAFPSRTRSLSPPFSWIFATQPTIDWLGTAGDQDEAIENVEIIPTKTRGE